MLPYESPIELLEDTCQEIVKDIEWYETSHQNDGALTRTSQQKRVKALKKRLAEYEQAISILKNHASTDNYEPIQHGK